MQLIVLNPELLLISGISIYVGFLIMKGVAVTNFWSISILTSTIPSLINYKSCKDDFCNFNDSLGDESADLSTLSVICFKLAGELYISSYISKIQ